MEDKIEVGEWIRTIKGKIFKAKEECYYDECFNEYMIDGEEYCTINIVKHSKNIIDLIEVGDYVNGNKVVTLYMYDEDGNDKEELGIEMVDCEEGYYIPLTHIDIKSIVTKEQFTSMEYRLGGIKQNDR